jgi:molybdate transport system substrate-binding protein
MKRAVGAVAALVLLSPLAACGGSDGSSGSTDSSGTTTLTVFAASSLTSAFTELGKDFEADHDGVKATFSFAGSSDLVAQLQEGAAADVFASADTNNMDAAVGDDLVDGGPVNFASNTLEIATPPDNPANVKSFQDLAKGDVQVVVCAPEVPCGAATQKMEDVTGVTIEPVSEEDSVTDVLTKVESGEADAGLVYVTDVQAAGDKVAGVTFPESSQVVNTYPIATLSDSKNADLAKEFVALVTGAKGQSTLAAAGFAWP